MKKKLKLSLNEDKKLFNRMLKNKNNLLVKKFIYEVKILKNKYLRMIKDRYISTLLDFTDDQIKKGISEIKNDYKDVIRFRDRLICFIIKKN